MAQLMTARRDNAPPQNLDLRAEEWDPEREGTQEMLLYPRSV